MSMSQEEIEALMNGLDISDDESDSEEIPASPKVNTQEIEELLSQTEDLKENIKKEDNVVSELPPKVEVEEETFELDNIDELLTNNSAEVVNNNDIDELLKDLDSSKILENNDNEDEELSLDDIVNEQEEIEAKSKIEDEKYSKTEDELVKNWTSNKIDEGIFPFPADQDTKVVNQLSQVANDSEEKVSQIFDVLSLTLDNNRDLRDKIKNIEKVMALQSTLLISLNSKFPNIAVFNENLNSITSLNDEILSMQTIMNEEDNKIFQAMELMQFNDINRQKIERVMSVIRKLSKYLNNLFEDDGSSKEVAVAKHIHGDESNDLIGDDLDKLIEEFSQKD